MPKINETQTQDAGERITVRLLVDHAGIKCGGLANVAAIQADALIAQGVADGTPEAIAYAVENGETVTEI